MARVVAVGSAVLDRVYALSNLPEPDGGAFVTDEAERAGRVAASAAAKNCTAEGARGALATRNGFPE